MAGRTGLEPATSDVTGRRSNQLNYRPRSLCLESTTVESLHPTQQDYLQSGTFSFVPRPFRTGPALPAPLEPGKRSTGPFHLRASMARISPAQPTAAEPKRDPTTLKLRGASR